MGIGLFEKKIIQTKCFYFEQKSIYKQICVN